MRLLLPPASTKPSMLPPALGTAPAFITVPALHWGTPKPQAFFSGINHKPPAAKESHQRHPKLARHLHGQARGGGNRSQQGDSRHQRFLDDLKSPSATRQQRAIGERKAALQQRPADEFIHRVVTAHVLLQGQQLPGRVEQSGRVQPPVLPKRVWADRRVSGRPQRT